MDKDIKKIGGAIEAFDKWQIKRSAFLLNFGGKKDGSQNFTESKRIVGTSRSYKNIQKGETLPQGKSFSFCYLFRLFYLSH